MLPGTKILEWNSNTFTIGRNILLKNAVNIKKKIDSLVILESILKYSDFVSIACLLWQSIIWNFINT